MNFCIVNTIVVLFCFGIASSTNLPCKYDFFEPYVLGNIYRCFIENELKIDNESSAYITSASGWHRSGYNNDNVIHFKSYDNKVDYFPKNLENIFKNLKGIHIYKGGIKAIHQSDLRPLPNLRILYLEYLKIEALEDGLFNFNENLEAISFIGNKIFYIGPNVFFDVPKLTYLWMSENDCINKDEISGSRVAALEFIKYIQLQCTNTDYKKLEQSLNQLKLEIETLTFASIKIKLNELSAEFGSSNNTENFPYKKIIESFWCNLWNYSESNIKVIGVN